MAYLMQKLEETVNYIKSRLDFNPEVGIILGSGLGNFASGIDVRAQIPYADIPNFPVSTVVGHSGKLILGTIGGKRILAMSGRFHFYEGYAVEDVVFPVRVMGKLGIKLLMVSNAAGSVHPDHEVGDLVVIRDHISLSVPNPLIGKNIDELGPRFPDMSEPYRRDLREKLIQIARENHIKIHEGVYYGVTGPTFETRAEYQMIRILGADLVGMSTVQEVITAVHMGLPVVAVSIVTDLGIREDNNTITHDEVLEAAAAAEPKLTTIFSGLISGL